MGTNNKTQPLAEEALRKEDGAENGNLQREARRRNGPRNRNKRRSESRDASGLRLPRLSRKRARIVRAGQGHTGRPRYPPVRHSRCGTKGSLRRVKSFGCPSPPP